MNRYAVLPALLLVMACPGLAQAYLDPGAGSMLLQALAVAAIGAGVFWRRILDVFRGIFKKQRDDS